MSRLTSIRILGATVDCCFFLSIDHFLKRATTTTPATTTAVPTTKKAPTGPAKLIEDVHVIQGFLKLPNKGDWSSLAHLSKSPMT